MLFAWQRKEQRSGRLSAIRWWLRCLEIDDEENCCVLWSKFKDKFNLLVAERVFS
jgi:hypothetical protein